MTENAGVTNNDVYTRPKWEYEFSEKYKSHLNFMNIDNVCHRIDILAESQNVTQANIDDLYNDIKGVLKDSAIACCSRETIQKGKKKVNHVVSV